MDKEQLLQEGYREARYISSKENKTYIFNDYFVNRDGEVWSFRTNKILDGNFHNGYKIYGLYTTENGKNKKIAVYGHVLIASTFFEETNINNTDDDNTFEQVHHINHNANDNRPENLLWIGKVEHNKLHSKSDITRKKLSKNSKGEHNPMYGRKGENNPTSIKVIAYTDTGSYYQEFVCIMDAGRELGVDNSGIGKCCKGKQKSAGKYNGEPIRWRYKE